MKLRSVQILFLLTKDVTISLTLCTALWLSPVGMAPIEGLFTFSQNELLVSIAKSFIWNVCDVIGNVVKGICHWFVFSDAIRVSNKSSESGHIRSKSRSADWGTLNMFVIGVFCALYELEISPRHPFAVGDSTLMSVLPNGEREVARLDWETRLEGGDGGEG